MRAIPPALVVAEIRELLEVGVQSGAGLREAPR